MEIDERNRGGTKGRSGRSRCSVICGGLNGLEVVEMNRGAGRGARERVWPRLMRNVDRAVEVDQGLVKVERSAVG